VSAPVLADLKLDFGGVSVSDTYPEPLPDLFAGSQLVLVGRYRDGGDTTITLRGTVNGESRSFEYGDQRFRQSGGDEFIPRLWATRKIGYLLNQIRLKGENQEWVQTIVNLSVRYGIVTPYTSYLITEEDILTSAGREGAADDQLRLFEAAPAPASGAGAVQTSQDQAALQSADSAAAPSEEYTDAVKILGVRAFVNVNGIWTDTQFDPSTMTTTAVQFAGDDYFDLLAARPELGAAFALGERVIVVSDGVAYEVISESAPPIEIPPSVTPEPSTSNNPPPALPGPTSTPGGGSFCPGALVVLGLVAIPLVRRRK
ncbi:MAG: hypothetical protein AAB427_04590, partial [Chloroflexota bacterium]